MKTKSNFIVLICPICGSAQHEGIYRHHVDECRG